jgi:hypothetical protein
MLYLFKGNKIYILEIESDNCFIIIFKDEWKTIVFSWSYSVVTVSKGAFIMEETQCYGT